MQRLHSTRIAPRFPPTQSRSSEGLLLTALITTLWSTNAMTAPPATQRTAAPALPTTSPPATQVRGFHVDAPREKVFLLFTPLGERAWAPGWEPVILSGAEERGTAFRTRDHSGRETTWVVTEYRPTEGRVSYARLVEHSNIGLVDVICTESSGGGTEVSVRYTLTPISQEGRARVQQFLSDASYAEMIDEWRSAVGAALRVCAAQSR